MSKKQRGPARKRARRSNGSRVNEGASTSSGISPYEALASENATFSETYPEIWIQCDKCDKWRCTHQYFETKEVPEKWQCKMWRKEDGRLGSCYDPGSTEDPNVEHEPFPEGDIVWAKLGRSRYWPGMIESDPGKMISTRKTVKGTKQYHVTFFGLKPSHQWVRASRVRKYEKTDPEECERKSIKMAVQQGNEAFDEPFSVRIVKFSLATLLAKRWEVSFDEDAENSNVNESEADGRKESSADDTPLDWDLNAPGSSAQPQLLASRDSSSPTNDENTSLDSASDSKGPVSSAQPQLASQSSPSLSSDSEDSDGSLPVDGTDWSDDELSPRALKFKEWLDIYYPPCI